MATFPTPSELFAKFKTTLKNLRPDLNVDDANSDVIIRGRALTGVISGVLGDQKAVDNDTFIQDARLDALLKKGADLGIARQPATAAVCTDVLFTGTVGAIIPAGTVLRYIPTGVLYSVAAALTLDALGQAHGAIGCNVTGQIGNVKAGGTLSFDSPPVGVNQLATLVEDLSSGADIESVDSYRSRLLSRMQRPPAGGNQYDYPNFAYDADPSVRSALIKRWGRGLGTVDVYITSGTTDIDTAINQGLPIIRVPNPATIDAVQAYYVQNAPLTDCVLVAAPTEITLPVSVKVDLFPGLTMSSVPADSVNNPMNLNCAQLIEREISRVLYKIPVGGRRIPGYTNGFVVASDIEAQLDRELSGVVDTTTGLYFGKIPILVDRQVQPLDGLVINKAILPNQIVAPGVLTIIEGV